MRILPRPIGALILIAIAAAAYGGYERLWHPHPSRVAELPKPAAEPPMPPTPPAAIAARASTEAAPQIEPPTRMTSAQQAGFDTWLIKTYLACWKPPKQPSDADVYVAHVRLAYNPDGSLSKPAKLVNPPSDPALKPQAKSVLAAVENCNPLPVPAQYRPYYEQWKTKTIHFDPQVAAR
jgi:colicin import membrane protein